jgi:hypothetical protein
MGAYKAFARPRISSVRETLAYNTRSSRVYPPFRWFCYTSARSFQMDQSLHICDIDAEPLHRYHKGGYHPVHLGDLLSNGRYKILHKLGWGGYSTVWAARDQRFPFPSCPDAD